MIEITEQELADFVAWMSRTIQWVSNMRGAKSSVIHRRQLLLEELRKRAFAKKPEQVEMFL